MPVASSSIVKTGHPFSGWDAMKLTTGEFTNLLSYHRTKKFNVERHHERGGITLLIIINRFGGECWLGNTERFAL